MARRELGHGPSWIRSQVILVLGLLVPLTVLVPLRALFVTDADLLTVAVLGPATEESLKLAGVVVAALLGAVLASPGSGAVGLRVRLLLAPWIVGGLYGAYEGLTLYAGESSLVLLVRIWVHAGAVALGLAVCLAYWRLDARPLTGAWVGWLLATVVHIGFNAFAFLPGVDTPAQALYAALLVVVALAVLLRIVSGEPASASAAAFLGAPAVRVRA